MSSIAADFCGTKRADGGKNLLAGVFEFNRHLRPLNSRVIDAAHNKEIFAGLNTPREYIIELNCRYAISIYRKIAERGHSIGKFYIYKRFYDRRARYVGVNDIHHRIHLGGINRCFERARHTLIEEFGRLLRAEITQRRKPQHFVGALEVSVFETVIEIVEIPQPIGGLDLHLREPLRGGCP